MQTLAKNWWLLALCGVLYAVSSFMYFIMLDPDNFLVHPSQRTLMLLGKLALGAGACAIAAGLWGSTTGKCWLLLVNGLAFGALGLLFSGIFGFSIRLVTIVLLIVVMAMSLGMLEWITARTLWHRRHVGDGWFFALAGAASIGFALAFFALAFGFIRLEPGIRPSFILFGSYYGFTAISMLALALRLHRPAMVAILVT